MDTRFPCHARRVVRTSHNEWHPLGHPSTHRFAMAIIPASPTSPAKQRTQSVGALLEPWIEEFAKHGHAKITTTKTKSGSRERETTTIEFVFLALSSGHTTRDEIIALREALEVMHIASLLDVRDVQEALSGLSYHDFEESETGDEASNETKASDGAVAFVLTFYGTSGRFLDDVVARALFTESYEHSQAFQGTVDALGWDAVKNGQPPLQCRVNLVSMDNDFEEEPETDYIGRVMSFVHQLDGVGKEKHKENGPEDDDDHLDIRVTGVDLDLNQMGVSKAEIDAAAQLKEVALPVRCSRVALDPRALSCSAQELSSFLESLGSQTTEMTVEIGRLQMCEPTDSLEGNQEEIIEQVFRGIAGTSCVTSVSFGPLLAMLDSLSSRKALWMELFASLANESARTNISSLVLSPQIQLLEEDAVFINEAVAAIGQELALKSVLLWISESPPTAVQALIKAVGSRAEALTLHNETQGITTSETVEFIATECPQLCELTLSGAEIDSMAVFTEKTPQLRSLSLRSTMLKDIESVSHFFMALGNPTHALAKNLHKLQIKIDNHAPHTLVIGDLEARVVAEMLNSNKTLRHLELTMSDDTSTTTMAAIHKHDKEVLSDPLCLAQKLAFLSVIQGPNLESSESCRSRVDHDVVQFVFDFGAERILRRIELDW